MDKKRAYNKPIPLFKQANVTTEVVGTHRRVDTVYELLSKNVMCWDPKGRA